ncbi:hypothetical protein PEC331060_07030 [Pectobacterium carotovorum subsp. carotovorum]|nr:hypothetical protein PEC331060_07030 [Pectobacterium carotovorum subsp. carotovorum]
MRFFSPLQILKCYHLQVIVKLNEAISAADVTMCTDEIKCELMK